MALTAMMKLSSSSFFPAIVQCFGSLIIDSLMLVGHHDHHRDPCRHAALVIKHVGSWNQASLVPYAWQRDSHERPKDHQALCGSGLHLQRGEARSRSPCPKDSKSDLRTVWLEDEKLRDLARTHEVFEYLEMEKHMSYDLPKPGATAGRILAHASKVFERLQGKHCPMTFKFGFTHCPRFRWCHRPWGYQHAIEKFEAMVICFAAPDPVGPAFLEAALIDKFGSTTATMRDSDGHGGKW